MGKDLHYTIRPFIERVLLGHQNVQSFELLENPQYFIYKICRKQGMSDLKVILADDYHFGEVSKLKIMPLLKGGGYILLAKPEANGIVSNDTENKVGIGKIGKLLGALNVEEYWNYIPPQKGKAPN